MRHAANSAGTLAFPDAHFDLVRVGLTLYGTSPSGHMPPGLGLSPALAFRARVALTGAVRPGVAVATGIYWNKLSPGRANVNATTSSALTDMGGGATFFDNLVDVRAVEPPERDPFDFVASDTARDLR